MVDKETCVLGGVKSTSGFSIIYQNFILNKKISRQHKATFLQKKNVVTAISFPKNQIEEIIMLSNGIEILLFQ